MLVQYPFEHKKERTCWEIVGLACGPVAGLVGIKGGVVSEVINLESSGVGAPDRRPRHEQQYHEVACPAV